MCNSPEIVVSLDVVTPPPPEIPWLLIGAGFAGIAGFAAITNLRKKKRR